MNNLEHLSDSYCKIALTPSNSLKGIVQSGLVKNVDIKNRVIVLENENGIIRLPFHQICAVKKVKLTE
jgi:hypothetical protein